jgi:hypothetical protein
MADAVSILGRLADAWVPGDSSGSEYEPALGASGGYAMLGWNGRYLRDDEGGPLPPPPGCGFDASIY